MSRKKLTAQFAWISGGRVVAAALQALLLVLLARNAGPADFGLIGSILGLIVVVQAGADLGLTTLIVRERARDRSSGLLNSALKLTGPVGALLFGGISVGLGMAGLLADARFYLMLPLALWASAERYADTWLGVSLADGDAYINTSNLVVRRTLSVVLFVMLGSLADPLLAFSTAQAVSAAASALVVRQVIQQRVNLGQGSVAVGRVLQRARPFWVNTLGTQARNFDVFLVTVISGATQAGFYSAASRMTSPLRIVSTSLSTVILPLAARADRREVGKLIRLSVGVTSAMGAVYALGAFWMPVIVDELLGAEYVSAVEPLRITLTGLIFAAGASLFGSILQGVGLQRYVATAAVTSTVLCLLFVIIGALTAGAVGASWALFASFVIQLAMLIFGLVRWLMRGA